MPTSCKKRIIQYLIEHEGWVNSAEMQKALDMSGRSLGMFIRGMDGIERRTITGYKTGVEYRYVGDKEK